MNYPNNSHKWSLLILHANIHSHSTRNILYINLKQKQSMNIRSSNYISSYSHRISRICSPMRTNIILGSHSNHRSIIRDSNRRKRSSNLNLRRTLSIPTNIKSILFSSLHSSNTNCCFSPIPLNSFTRKRLFKSHKHNNQLR